MFTGLQSESLRSELREMVKGDWLTSDNKLLSYTRKAAENKAERDSKFGESEDKSESSDEVKVNVMSSVCHSKEKKKKENPFVRIEELLMKQDKEIKEMRTEIIVFLRDPMVHSDFSGTPLEPLEIIIIKQKFVKF